MGALSTTVLSQSGISKSDLAQLKRAKLLLENPSLAARASAMLGSPVERGMAMLPARFQKSVHQASEAAMMKALDVAVGSLNETAIKPSKNRLHKFAAAASGASPKAKARIFNTLIPNSRA
jgi:hypothetical protein